MEKVGQMWTDGYVTDIEYTHGFYPELSPRNLAFSTLTGQLDWQIPEQDFTYLELGFGQGVSLNINAAVTPGSYWGTDFNPSQTANAQALAKAGGTNVKLFDESFADFVARRDLPDFDVIALHGIWSWISDKNREFIVELLRKRLKPGGLCYISYNTLPGWSGITPLQHLLTQHAEFIGKGALPDRVNEALTFAHTLAEAGAQYFQDQPGAFDRLVKIRDEHPNYVAHEFFNAEWHPMPFGDLAKIMAEAKLSFGTSARVGDQIDALNISTGGRKILSSFKNPTFAEGVKDFLMNRQFRRDIFIKGPRSLSGFEGMARWHEQAFVVIGNPDKPPRHLTVPMGNLNLEPKIYDPVISALLYGGGEPKIFSEIQGFPGCKVLPKGQLIQALQLLSIAGFIAPVQPSRVIDKVSLTTRYLNDELCRRAEFSKEVMYLAAPLIGSGFPVGRIDQIFLRAETLKVDDVAAYAWSVLKVQGELLEKDGSLIRDDAGNLVQLRSSYRDFVQERRPLLKRLGIA